MPEKPLDARESKGNCYRAVLAPRLGAVEQSNGSGGLRFAATTGYFLLTLRVNELDSSGFISRKRGLENWEADYTLAGTGSESELGVISSPSPNSCARWTVPSDSKIYADGASRMMMSCRRIRPYSNASGRGGHPGM